MSYAIFRGEGIKILHELPQKGRHNEKEKNTNLILILEPKIVKIILK